MDNTWHLEYLAPTGGPAAGEGGAGVIRRGHPGAAPGRRRRADRHEGDCGRAGVAQRTSRLHPENGEVSADQVLVAVGRKPVTEGLELPASGVRTDERGFVRTNTHLATSAKGIFAVGDVAGSLQFTHAAEEMGRIAAANAFSRYPGGCSAPTGSLGSPIRHRKWLGSG